ncbi:MAG: hypothetical protein ACKVPX_12485 [Myxococcaceae bacterium]
MRISEVITSHFGVPKSFTDFLKAHDGALEAAAAGVIAGLSPIPKETDFVVAGAALTADQSGTRLYHLSLEVTVPGGPTQRVFLAVTQDGGEVRRRELWPPT